jgi:hypothetical protein
LTTLPLLLRNLRSQPNAADAKEKSAKQLLKLNRLG